LLGCGVTWLSGHLTILATGGGWPPASLNRSPTLLAKLLRHHNATSAWSAAYPRQGGDVRSGWLFWTFTAALTLPVLVGAAFVYANWLARHPGWRNGRRPSDSIDAATWATRQEETPLVVPDQPQRRRWRLVAGRSTTSRKLLAGDDCVS